MPGNWWMINVASGENAPPNNVNLVTSVFAIALLYVVASVLVMGITKIYDRKGVHVHAMHKALVKWAIVITGLMLYLGSQKVNLTPLFFGMGALSVIVGLALQEPLSNLFSGLTMDMEGVINRGDWIELDSRFTGRVLDKGWRSTRVETLQNQLLVIPNRALTSEKVINYNRPAPCHFRDITIGAGYAHSPVKVRQILKNILVNEPEVLGIPEPAVYVSSYSDYAIIYRLRFAIMDYGRHLAIEDSVLTHIWYEFKRNGIQIPFPIRTVHQYDARHVAEELETKELEIENLIGLIEKFDTFAGLPHSAIEYVALNAHRLTYEPVEPIIRRGGHGDHAFFVVEGDCEVNLPNGKNRVISVGDYFGEMALLGSGIRTADVIAGKGGATLIRIDKESMTRIFAESPTVREKFEQTHGVRSSESDKVLTAAPQKPSLAETTAKMARKWLVPW